MPDTITIFPKATLRFQRVAKPLADTVNDRNLDPTQPIVGVEYWTSKPNEIQQAPAWIKEDKHQWAAVTRPHPRTGAILLEEYAHVETSLPKTKDGHQSQPADPARPSDPNRVVVTGSQGDMEAGAQPNQSGLGVSMSQPPDQKQDQNQGDGTPGGTPSEPATLNDLETPEQLGRKRGNK